MHTVEAHRLPSTARRLTRLIARRLAPAATAVSLAASGVATPARAATSIRATDWPTYGHDPHHTFSGATTITKAGAPSLAQAWFFPTGDAVTANPIVAAGTVYAGSWDGNFYAVDAATGRQRWKFAIKPQPAVSPEPGKQPRDITSDGGLITSSAWFEPGLPGSRPDLVIFGGGYTLYALDARTGALYWQHDYTGLPEQPPDPNLDGTRIFSSPVVVGNMVLFGVSPDGARGYRGYFTAADLGTGNPLWRFETDVNTAGAVQNDGCGGVWSSGTVIESLRTVVFDVADCHFTNTPPYSESVIALHISDGSKSWVFRPSRTDPHCDFDFGATVNLGTTRGGTPTFLGVGGKDGTYYSLDPATGRPRWTRNVVFGGFAGGFIGTAAYDGKRVYGATALGDFGRFEGIGGAGCSQGDPRDQPVQEPSMHSLDAHSGHVVWQGVQSQSFGPTTVAGGMTFVGTGITRQIQIRDAGTGTLIRVIPLQAPSDSGVVAAGNALFFGTGSSEQGTPAGVAAYTPIGARPTAG